MSEPGFYAILLIRLNFIKSFDQINQYNRTKSRFRHSHICLIFSPQCNNEFFNSLPYSCAGCTMMIDQY